MKGARIKQERPLFWQHCSASLVSRMVHDVNIKSKVGDETPTSQLKPEVTSAHLTVGCVCATVRVRIARHRTYRQAPFSPHLAHCLFKIHFNVLSSTKWAFKCSIPFTFFDENFACTCHLSRACYTCIPTQPVAPVACSVRLQSRVLSLERDISHSYILTGNLRTGRLCIVIRYPGRARDFSLFNIVQTRSVAHPESYPMCIAKSFLRVKAAGMRSWKPTPYSAEVNKEWSCTITPPYVFMAWSETTLLNIINSVHFNFIFKVRQMYNSITLTVYFHCPTCFEPLIWFHLQGLIISNHTLFAPTGTTR
jgi:hypothetical protein